MMKRDAQNKKIFFFGATKNKEVERANSQLQQDVYQIRNDLDAANNRVNEFRQRMDNANANLNRAKFWGQAGDEFLSTHSLNQAQSDLGW